MPRRPSHVGPPYWVGEDAREAQLDAAHGVDEGGEPEQVDPRDVLDVEADVQPDRLAQRRYPAVLSGRQVGAPQARIVVGSRRELVHAAEEPVAVDAAVRQRHVAGVARDADQRRGARHGVDRDDQQGVGVLVDASRAAVVADEQDVHPLGAVPPVGQVDGIGVAPDRRGSYDEPTRGSKIRASAWSAATVAWRARCMATVMIISRTTTATVAGVRGRVGIGVSPASPIGRQPRRPMFSRRTTSRAPGTTRTRSRISVPEHRPSDHPDQEQDRCGKEQAEAGPSGVGLAESGNRNENAAASAALGR